MPFLCGGPTECGHTAPGLHLACLARAFGRELQAIIDGYYREVEARNSASVLCPELCVRVSVIVLCSGSKIRRVCGGYTVETTTRRATLPTEAAEWSFRRVPPTKRNANSIFVWLTAWLQF